MARKLSFVVKPAPSKFEMELDAIPQDIRDDVEEAYKACSENPNGRIRAEFDDKAELTRYESLVKAYCNVRPAGQIRFRKSPTKGLAENVMDFRITDLKTENEKATDEIRDAVAEANSDAKHAAKPSPRKSK